MNHSSSLDPVLNVLDWSFSIQGLWNINHLHFIPSSLGTREPTCELTLCPEVLVGERGGMHSLANTELDNSSILLHLENSEILRNVV